MKPFHLRTFHNEKDSPLRSIESIVLIALIFTMITSGARNIYRTGERIRSNTLRLHIIANSDEDYDQALKLKVRDRVISETGKLFAEVEGKSEAKALAIYSVNDIKATAEKVVAEEGYNYPISVEITETWFETRSYDGFTLPAGNYDAVQIVIGAGEGHNWWCVLYPQLCIPGAKDSLSHYGRDAAFIQGNGIEFRFAFLEWIENCRRFFQKQ